MSPAPTEKKGDSPFVILKFFLLIFIGIGVFWFITGGPERYASQAGLFLTAPNDPARNDRWGFYGTIKSLSNFQTDSKNNTDIFGGIKENTEQISQDLEKAKELAFVSFYKDKIFLETGGASNTSPDEEYLVIKVSSEIKDKINITGWKLESAITGQSVVIDKATYLPYTTNVNPTSAIFLSAEDTAIVTTGRSPIGASFKTNLCSGYFEQFQNFFPSLENNCPRPEEESDFISQMRLFNDQCIDYVEDLQRCRINAEPLPLNMQYECSSYISSKINYNTCVNNHKNQSNFYGSEWRIFLNRDEEIWKSRRETIKLLDLEGKIIDTITY